MPVRTPNALRLAAFWLGVQAVWGALLGISLQSRTIELAPANALVAYGRLATVGAIVAAIVQVLVGIWSDARRSRVGSRRLEFYVVGAAGGAIALTAFYDARTMVALTAAYVAVQAALNVGIGPYQAIIPDFVERARTGAASSWMAALQGAGNAVGALAASFIASLRLLGGVLAALLLASCAITAGHAARLPVRRPEPAGTRGGYSKRAFVDLFISRALVYVGFYTLLGYLLFYVTTALGIAPAAAARRETGIIIVAFTLLGAAGAAIAARPSDRLDKRLVATAGGAAFVAALLVFIAARGSAGVVVATALAGIGWGVFLVADWAIACRVLPPSAMAAAMGIWNLAIVLPQIAAPALTTMLLSVTGASMGSQAPRLAFALACVETSTGLAWLWRLRRCAIDQE